MLPVAWGDYFGRGNYGAIRGVALTGQVLAQASGPLLSGVLRDATGGYETSLACFAVLSGLSVLAASAGGAAGVFVPGATGRSTSVTPWIPMTEVIESRREPRRMRISAPARRA